MRTRLNVCIAIACARTTNVAHVLSVVCAWNVLDGEVVLIQVGGHARHPLRVLRLVARLGVERSGARESEGKSGGRRMLVKTLPANEACVDLRTTDAGDLASAPWREASPSSPPSHAPSTLTASPPTDEPTGSTNAFGMDWRAAGWVSYLRDGKAGGGVTRDPRRCLVHRTAHTMQ